jgi:glycosyltransferase involved in cell wall biosynthesis
MASARPVIVTSTCGVAAFVRDRESGCVVPPDDPEALRAAMQWFVDDPQRFAAAGARARDTYDRFSFDEYITALANDILETVEND